VEKDGSGDFTVIQEAVDAASDGDTIEIGPGRFDDYTESTVGPGWVFRVRVVLNPPKSLHMVGAGADVTTIGPDHIDETNVRDVGISAWSGDAMVVVEGIHFQNLDEYAITVSCSELAVRDCVFRSSGSGVVLLHDVNNAEIVGCRFIDGLPECTAVWGFPARVRIQDCEFRWSRGANLATVVSPDGSFVSDCTFIGGRSGLYLHSGTGGVVDSCRFEDLSVYAFAVDEAGDVTFSNNIVENCPGSGIDMGRAETLSIVGNTVENCHPCVTVIRPNVNLLVRDNFFLRDVAGDGYYIVTIDWYPYGPYTQDFSLNYWGTTDPDEVEQWILDGNDYDDVWIDIEFMPMADVVRTENRSWSGVKEMFR
jgi:hypothetical protein